MCLRPIATSRAPRSPNGRQDGPTTQMTAQTLRPKCLGVAEGRAGRRCRAGNRCATTASQNDDRGRRSVRVSGSRWS
eukprot:11180668-Lingulodinium_polyedra.AAC.1